MIQQLLTQLGFSEKEITVYVAILQRGKIAPSEVAKITGINRTTVYSIAKELSKKGVITEDLGSQVRYLVALPLEDLKYLTQKEEKELEQKKDLINKSVKELRILAKDAKYALPKIIFIAEKDLERYLYKQSKTWSDSIMRRDKTWWGFQDHTYVEHYGRMIDWYWQEIAPPGLTLNLLTNKSAVEREMKKKKYLSRKIKFWNNTKQFTASIWVCGDYVVMLITNQRPHYLVEINDATLAHNMREMFKQLWRQVK
ncbi:MAG: helix-turn-helix domain-containing protein [Candidatus Doudnabacteria bacterium]